MKVDRYILWLLLLMCISTSPALAWQEELPLDKRAVQPRTFDSEKLAEYAEDSDFDYNEAEHTVSIWERLLKWLGWQFSRMLDTTGAQKGFDLFLYLLAAVVVVFLILKWKNLSLEGIFVQDARKSRHQALFSPEDIAGTDFDALVQQSVAARNYREAVRFLYLKLLQQLQEQELIKWRADRTNQDYLGQLQGSGLEANFKEVTWYFDRVVYGHFTVEEKQYQAALARFGQFGAGQATATGKGVNNQLM